MNRAAAGFVAVVVSGGLTGLAYIGAQAATESRAPVADTDTQQVPSPQITRAEARAEVEIHGRTWAEFLTQTTDRPMYDIGFVSAWLNAPTATPTAVTSKEE